MSISRAIACTVLFALFPLGCTEPAEKAGAPASEPSAAPAPGLPPPESIVLVTIDTLRADHLGVYGYPRPVSPFLDRMAAEGILFRDVHSPISHTAPAHASLFTALYPQQHRLLRNGEPLADTLLTLSELLGARGYETGAFVEAGFLRGLSDGFDTFEVMGPPLPPAATTLGAARDWLEARKDRKTFLWIHLFDVHQWYVEKALDPTLAEEARELTPMSREAWEAYLDRERGLADVPDERARRQAIDAIDRYDGQILEVDRALDAFFGALEKEGADRRALWIVTADHGEGLGAHHFLGHGKNLYEEQLRVPLILRFPTGGPSGITVEQSVQLLDLYPTLAELTGSVQEVPANSPGTSLVPLFSPGASFPPRPLFAERRPVDQHEFDAGWDDGKLLAYRDGKWKLILSSAGRLELYDLAEDPLELHDRSAEEPEVTARLRDALLARFRRLRADGASVREEGIDPRHEAELKALGYL